MYAFVPTIVPQQTVTPFVPTNQTVTPSLSNCASTEEDRQALMELTAEAKRSANDAELAHAGAARLRAQVCTCLSLCVLASFFWFHKLLAALRLYSALMLHCPSF